MLSFTCLLSEAHSGTTAVVANLLHLIKPTEPQLIAPAD